MASIEGVALASQVLQNRQTASLAAVKQAVEAERAIVNLIAQTTGTQPVDPSGRGGTVNVLA